VGDAKRGDDRAGRLKIESLSDHIDSSTSVTIQPEPVALDLKIVLFGEPGLSQHLPDRRDFADLFKVQADLSAKAARRRRKLRAR